MLKYARADESRKILESLERGVAGIYHWFSRKHTSLYVDEFVFRLNEGNYAIDTVDRLESLVRGVLGK